MTLHNDMQQLIDDAPLGMIKVIVKTSDNELHEIDYVIKDYDSNFDKKLILCIKQA